MAEMNNITKVCSVCKEEKELNLFYKNKDSRGGFRNECKFCTYEKTKKLVAKNKKQNFLKDYTQVIKKCNFCKKEKSALEFYKKIKTKDGLDYACKCCIKIISEKRHDYYKETNFKNNNDLVKKCSVCKSLKNRDEFFKSNRYKTGLESRCKICSIKKCNIRHSERLKTDGLYALKTRFRACISKAMQRNGYSKKSKTQELLGCSWQQFKEHIEKQFVDGMSWDKLKEIHIDHKVPLATAKTYEDVVRLNHYTNLQPLWAKDNIRKSNKLNYVIQEKQNES